IPTSVFDASYKFFTKSGQRLSFRQARRKYPAGLKTMGALWQSEPTRMEAPETHLAEAPLPKTPRQRRLWWRLIVLVLLLAIIAIGFAVYDEVQTSKLQSREFSRLASTLTYSLEPGPSD